MADEEGERCVNLWIRSYGRWNGPNYQYGWESTHDDEHWDRVIIQTRGEGEYGAAEEKREETMVVEAFKMHEKFIRSPHLFRAGGSIGQREAMAAPN